jgi:hypothetical protein
LSQQPNNLSLICYTGFLLQPFRLEGKGFTVIEGVVGFAVIPDPKHGAAVASLPRPGILFERLTKEAVKVADGPLRLLERMDVDVSFRKTLTRKSVHVSSPR